MKQYLPPAARDQFEEIQTLQDEATDVARRRREAEDRLEDTEDALAAIADVDDAESVYRTVGTVRVETTAGAARSTLREKADGLEERIDDLQAEEDRLRERFERRKADVKHLLGGPDGGPNVGADGR